MEGTTNSIILQLLNVDGIVDPQYNCVGVQVLSGKAINDSKGYWIFLSVSFYTGLTAKQNVG